MVHASNDPCVDSNLTKIAAGAIGTVNGGAAANTDSNATAAVAHLRDVNGTIVGWAYFTTTGSGDGNLTVYAYFPGVNSTSGFHVHTVRSFQIGR